MRIIENKNHTNYFFACALTFGMARLKTCALAGARMKLKPSVSWVNSFWRFNPANERVRLLIVKALETPAHAISRSASEVQSAETHASGGGCLMDQLLQIQLIPVSFRLPVT